MIYRYLRYTMMVEIENSDFYVKNCVLIEETSSVHKLYKGFESKIRGCKILRRPDTN